MYGLWDEATARCCEGPTMRPSCVRCALKHLAQAIVLFGEAELGYPLHRWLAYGHMAEAESELVGDHPAVAAMVREARKEWEVTGKCNLMELLEVLEGKL